jgi:hypothetical protein
MDICIINSHSYYTTNNNLFTVQTQFTITINLVLGRVPSNQNDLTVDYPNKGYTRIDINLTPVPIMNESLVIMSQIFPIIVNPITPYSVGVIPQYSNYSQRIQYINFTTNIYMNPVYYLNNSTINVLVTPIWCNEENNIIPLSQIKYGIDQTIPGVFAPQL